MLRLVASTSPRLLRSSEFFDGLGKDTLKASHLLRHIRQNATSAGQVIADISGLVDVEVLDLCSRKDVKAIRKCIAHKANGNEHFHTIALAQLAENLDSFEAIAELVALYTKHWAHPQTLEALRFLRKRDFFADIGGNPLAIYRHPSLQWLDQQNQDLLHLRDQRGGGGDEDKSSDEDDHGNLRDFIAYDSEASDSNGSVNSAEESSGRSSSERSPSRQSSLRQHTARRRLRPAKQRRQSAPSSGSQSSKRARLARAVSVGDFLESTAV